MRSNVAHNDRDTAPRGGRRFRRDKNINAMGNPSALRISGNDATAVEAAPSARALPAEDHARGAEISGIALASLRQLQQLRTIAIVGQVIAIGIAHASGVRLPLAAMSAFVLALVVANVWMLRRLNRGTRATHAEVLGNLVFDIAIVTALLLLSGGTSNPFVMLYLLHVALVALLLPPRFALVGTMVVIAGWWLCLQYGMPLELVDGGAIPPLWIKAGRWAAFLLTAAMIAWFVSRASAALQAHQLLLAEAARKALNDEAMLRIGTIAAGAAHELSTPLTTMSVVVKEWQREGAAANYARDAKILTAQIAACKEALLHLRAAAGQARIEDHAAQPVETFFDDIAQRFRMMRPSVHLETRWECAAPVPTIAPDPGFAQAVLVLLNNAGDASPDYVLMSVDCNHTHLRIVVSDRGSGIPTETLGRLGRTFVTTKPPGKGTGLGLMLTASTVARLGGTVTWSNQPEGGARAEMRVPLSSLQRNPK